MICGAMDCPSATLDQARPYPRNETTHPANELNGMWPGEDQKTAKRDSAGSSGR